MGRVDIRDELGRLAGYGTPAPLVSSELLPTNHHVLSDAAYRGVQPGQFAADLRRAGAVASTPGDRSHPDPGRCHHAAS